MHAVHHRIVCIYVFRQSNKHISKHQNMKKLYAILASALLALSAGAATVDDVLTADVFGITKQSTYLDLSNVSATSKAVYAANVAKNNSDALQMRSKSNSGIITTATGGKLSKITVVWNSGTTTDRKIDVYGATTAYSSVSDLYDTSKAGPLIGSIVCGVTTELTITGDYTFVGLRSNNSALYADSITVSWETEGEEETVAAPTLSLESGKYTGSQSLVVTTSNDAQLYVKVNSDDFEQVTSPYTVSLKASDAAVTYEVEAYAQTGDKTSKTVKGTYVIIPESKSDYAEFILATSVAQLTAGSRVVIASNDEQNAMSKTWSYGESCTATSITVTDNKIATISNDVAVYTVYTDGTNYSFYDPYAVTSEGVATPGYICAVSSQKNYLGTQSALDNEGRFSVTMLDNGDATVVSQGDFTHNTLRFNYGAFRLYGSSTSITTLVRFYVEDAANSSVKAIDNNINTIRTAAGRIVANEMVNNSVEVSLPAGFYIVRFGATTAKVVIR